MANANDLVENPSNERPVWCLAKEGEIYVVFVHPGRQATPDLTGTQGRFDVHWFDPRTGASLQKGSTRTVTGGAPVHGTPTG